MLLENLLEESQLEEITKEVFSCYFPWYWQSSAISKEFRILTEKEYFSFTHIVFKDSQISSDIFPKIKKIIENFENRTKIKVKNIHRIQFNLLLNTDFSEEDEKCAIHADIESDNHISLVYYLNDSDGKTKFFDNERKNVLFEYEPKRGNCIYFKSNVWHCAIPPKKTKKRIVLNIILET
jgi:hypothetical protein